MRKDVFWLSLFLLLQFDQKMFSLIRIKSYFVSHLLPCDLSVLKQGERRDERLVDCLRSEGVLWTEELVDEKGVGILYRKEMMIKRKEEMIKSKKEREMIFQTTFCWIQSRPS